MVSLQVCLWASELVFFSFAYSDLGITYKFVPTTCTFLGVESCTVLQIGPLKRDGHVSRVIITEVELFAGLFFVLLEWGKCAWSSHLLCQSY
jgi:hypothetical protein